MANFVYNNYKALILSGDVDLVNDTIMCMLVSGSYPASEATAIDTHTTTGDIGANEVFDSQGAYPQGGSELTSRAIVTDDSNNRSYFDAANISWDPSTITAAGAVIYKSGDPAHLVGYIDFAGDKTSSNGVFQINWSANGILQINHGNT